MAVSGTEQAVESYLDEALGPDVLKKAANELFRGDVPIFVKHPVGML